MGTIGGKDGYAYAYHLGIKGYESRVSIWYGRWVWHGIGGERCAWIGAMAMVLGMGMALARGYGGLAWHGMAW